jgi:hypothetical protein
MSVVDRAIIVGNLSKGEAVLEAQEYFLITSAEKTLDSFLVRVRFSDGSKIAQRFADPAELTASINPLNPVMRFDDYPYRIKSLSFDYSAKTATLITSSPVESVSN